MVLDELDFSCLNPTEERKNELLPLVDEIMLKFVGMNANEILWLQSRLRFGTVLGSSVFTAEEYKKYRNRMEGLVQKYNPDLNPDKREKRAIYNDAETSFKKLGNQKV